MDKQNITRTFRKHGEFLCINEISDIMNLDRGTVRQILNGVPYIPVGKKKLYAVADVAEVLYRRQT